MKVCSKCNSYQPWDNFYKNSRYSDGYQGVCRGCQNKRMRELETSGARTEIIKRYRQSKKGKAVICKLAANYRSQNPKKIKAHSAAQKLTRQPCEICGDLKVHAHHDDYSKPLEVRFLCIKHHSQHHNGG